MKDKYYVIHGDENGDQYISEHTKEDLIEKLNNRHWGSIDPMKFIGSSLYMQEFSGLIIIKGDVVPQPIETVVKWKV